MGRKERGGPIDTRISIRQVASATHFEAYPLNSPLDGWLIQLRNDVNGNGSKDHTCTTPSICCDNQGALVIVSTGAIKQRTKHIDVCYHNSHELHGHGVVKYEYVNTSDNPADILSKVLARDKHEKFAKSMGIWQ